MKIFVIVVWLSKEMFMYRGVYWLTHQPHSRKVLCWISSAFFVLTGINQHISLFYSLTTSTQLTNKVSSSSILCGEQAFLYCKWLLAMSSTKKKKKRKAVWFDWVNVSDVWVEVQPLFWLMIPLGPSKH